MRVQLKSEKVHKSPAEQMKELEIYAFNVHNW